MAETDIQINKGVRGRMKDKEEAREESADGKDRYLDKARSKRKYEREER